MRITFSLAKVLIFYGLSEIFTRKRPGTNRQASLFYGKSNKKAPADKGRCLNQQL
jgi:hypothetical protein